MERDGYVVAVVGLLLLAGVSAVPAPVHAGTNETPFAMTVPPVEGTPGDNVTIEVTLKNRDHNTVSKPVMDFGRFPDGWTATKQRVENGWWEPQWSQAEWVGIRPGDAVTVTLTFEVPETGAGQYSIPVRVEDANGNEVAGVVEVVIAHPDGGSDEESDADPGDGTGNESDVAREGVDVVGDGVRSTDTDGDGYHDDVDGDGDFDVFDVEAIFLDVAGDGVAADHGIFDFDGDGEVDIFDVVTLFGRL